jgi:integrase/recombinase XerD
MVEICWDRFPQVTHHEYGQRWLTLWMRLGRAKSTLEAYGYALDDYFAFCQRNTIPFDLATREHISLYIHELVTRPHSRMKTNRPEKGLANATIQQ